MTTFNEGFFSCILLPIAWIKWVLPRPTPPYIIKGLKEFLPGSSETVSAAVLAKSLLEPCIKELKVYVLLRSTGGCTYSFCFVEKD